MGRLAFVVAVVGLLACAPRADADDWLPHPDDATWTYVWTDSAYQPAPTKERVSVKAQKGDEFTLAWTTEDQGNAEDAASSVGTVSFRQTLSGLFNTDWSSNPPPAAFPILCAQLSQCGNSLASTYYNVIWGSRAPVLFGPLVKGAHWSSTGGVQGDVTSTSDYVGVEKVSVPAFPQPVAAAKVRTEITQAGAIGDPYGSGVRTIWWVYGVGPVKMVFEHAGGAGAPVTTSVLQATNQVPKSPPPDDDYFPLRKGLTETYRWTNDRYLTQPVVERFSVDDVLNASARISVKSVSGPIRVSGAYGFTSRIDGVTNIWGLTKAASLARLPKLGPRSLPAAKRRHFFTPFDLMTFGFNPLLPAYPQRGSTWTGVASGRDYSLYGVTGRSVVLGRQAVSVPAGRFNAIAVRSVLQQPGFPFGSGTRTTWFAPGRGLVKLVFQHADGSTSRVELIR